jgi:hypothetical protein
MPFYELTLSLVDPGSAKWYSLRSNAVQHPLTSYPQRCDGTKPSCQQCVRAKKGDACEYDDGKGKTRTQLLRENIVRLEQRIRELEDPEYISPAVTLYDPHAHSRSGSSSSSFSSPGDTSFSASHSPFPSGASSVFSSGNDLPTALCADSPTSPNASWCHLQVSINPSRPPFVI